MCVYLCSRCWPIQDNERATRWILYICITVTCLYGFAWSMTYVNYTRTEMPHFTTYQCNGFRLTPSVPIMVDALYVTDRGDSSSAIVDIQLVLFQTFNATFPRLLEYDGFWKGHDSSTAYLSLFSTPEIWPGWEIGQILLIVLSVFLFLSVLDVLLVHYCLPRATTTVFLRQMH